MAFNTEAEAKAAGQKVKEKLGGGRWRVRVWENLGWHFDVRLGQLVVREQGRGFVASLEDPDGGGTPYYRHTVACFHTPIQAVNGCLKFAQHVLDEHIKTEQGLIDQARALLPRRFEESRKYRERVTPQH
jgi:hypothetical protein